MSIELLLWDVDGTLAETERDGHRVAFNQVFEEHGLPWHWSVERYGELLAVAGGRERLLHDMTTRADAPVLSDERTALARRLHARKNEIYAAIVATGSLPLRPGVRELLDECSRRGVRMGITTTTSHANIDALLRAHLGPSWRDCFEVVVGGEDVSVLKPHPEVFLLALERAGVTPLRALALEDSPGGVAAARGADVPVVVTRSAYFQDAIIDAAIAIGPDFGHLAGWRPAADAAAGAGRVGFDQLSQWHARMETVSHFA